VISKISLPLLLLIGFQTAVIGLIADLIGANRHLVEDLLYHLRRQEADNNKAEKAGKQNWSL
jgi:hypothetical protein